MKVSDNLEINIDWKKEEFVEYIHEQFMKSYSNEILYVHDPRHLYNDIYVPADGAEYRFHFSNKSQSAILTKITEYISDYKYGDKKTVLYRRHFWN